MQNAAIAALFDEYADLLELQAANPFRVRAYRNASRTIGDCTESILEMVLEPVHDLTKLSGIGKDLAEKIETVVTTGKLPQLEELRSQFSPDLVRMLRIPGLGPKKVAALLDQLHVKTLADLQVACDQGQVAKLKGFGKKTEQTILEGLKQLEHAEQRVYPSVAKAAADRIVEDLAKVPGVSQVSAAGSCRRRKETCGDLDILAVAANSAAIMDRLGSHQAVQKVLARGETKQTVLLAGGLQLDLRVVPEESFGAALQYFTGSKEHNIVIRLCAEERGLKINEWAVTRGDEYVVGRTEEEVYAAVDLPWIPPELRENRGEIELAEQNRLPTLIQLDDIQGDLHMHTTATDGSASIQEMAEAAKARGLKYIAITDHSKRVSMAKGLNAGRLRAHWQEIRKVREKMKGIEILCGIECDILEDASMDLDDEVLAEADWVIAVLHYGLKQPREQIQKRLLNAIRNPNVDVIGHPSGRMIGHRPGADVHFPEIFKAAADHGVMMEINANPARLDLNDIQAAAAKDRGIPIVINTDSHATNGFEVLEYGVYQARRAGLTKADVANTRPINEFRKLIERKK